MSSFSMSGRQLLSVLLSVVISIMAVSFMANAVSYIDADSVGVATATPGGALGVKGNAHVDGFAIANSFNATSSGSIFQWEANDATSTTYAVGIGGSGSVKGNWNVEGTSTISSLYATSTLSVGSSSPDMAFSVIGDSLINGTLGVLNVLDVQGTGASTIDGLLSIGATSSPSYTLAVAGFGSVKGNWNVEGTSTISSLYATSTLSVGSSSPDMAFSVIGDSLINGSLALGNILDVQGTATSTIDGGLTVDYDTFVVDSAANSVAIGTTTTSGPEGITGPAPKLIIGTGSASTTVLITGGAEVGGALILKSANGDGCILISPDKIDADADGTIALVGKVVSCPE